MFVVCLLVALASGQSTAPPPLLQHISDFTDPATGRNPFLDLLEGRTAPSGRGLMRDNPPPPPLDFELVEGGAEDGRRWGFQPSPTTTTAPPTTVLLFEEEEPVKGVAVPKTTVAAIAASVTLLVAVLMGVVWWKCRRSRSSSSLGEKS